MIIKVTIYSVNSSQYPQLHLTLGPELLGLLSPGPVDLCRAGVREANQHRKTFGVKGQCVGTTRYTRLRGGYAKPPSARGALAPGNFLVSKQNSWTAE